MSAEIAGVKERVSTAFRDMAPVMDAVAFALVAAVFVAWSLPPIIDDMVKNGHDASGTVFLILVCYLLFRFTFALARGEVFGHD